MNLTKKMERWIETRLWNQKVKNESITIRQIIFELSTLFKIDVTPETYNKLERKIEQIRSRIYKRYKKWLTIRSEWAIQLALPEQLIQRWYRRGWIDPQNQNNLPDLMGIIFERDYYIAFIQNKNIDDQVPDDPDCSLSMVSDINT